jgi:hypothetical protein
MLHIESLYYDSVQNQRAIAMELVSVDCSRSGRGFRSVGSGRGRLFWPIVAKVCSSRNRADCRPRGFASLFCRFARAFGARVEGESPFELFADAVGEVFGLHDFGARAPF